MTTSQAQTIMSRNNKTIIVVTFLFFAMCPVMILAGIDLTYKSAISNTTSVPSVQTGAPKDSVALDFAMAIPGIVLIVFGYLGVFIMLLKVPTKEITGYKDENGSNGGRTLQNPILSEKITKISLPVWWLVKNKGVYSKIE